MTIVIKFLAQFEGDLLAERKWATTRFKRLGKVGDQFIAFGQLFELTKVEEKQLCDVAACHYEAEGFASPEEFKKTWSRLHQRTGYSDYQYVKYHEFKKVKS